MPTCPILSYRYLCIFLYDTLRSLWSWNDLTWTWSNTSMGKWFPTEYVPTYGLSILCSSDPLLFQTLRIRCPSRLILLALKCICQLLRNRLILGNHFYQWNRWDICHRHWKTWMAWFSPISFWQSWLFRWQCLWPIPCLWCSPAHHGRWSCIGYSIGFWTAWHIGQ